MDDLALARTIKRLAAWMDDVAQNINDEARIARVAAEVAELCRGFPAPGIRL